MSALVGAKETTQWESMCLAHLIELWFNHQAVCVHAHVRTCKLGTVFVFRFLSFNSVVYSTVYVLLLSLMEGWDSLVMDNLI